MIPKSSLRVLPVLLFAAATTVHAAPPSLIATATLDQPTDASGLTDTLENGMPNAVFGGLGSGLTWAGGTTFLSIPDRGPNATPYVNGGLDDNTTSYISRFHTLSLALSPVPSGS